MEEEGATGRCLCGRVEFRITFPTDFVAHCHCRSCQLSHAAPFVTWTSVPMDRFEFVAGEGEVRWYRSSEFILWGFCGTCGSSLLYRADKEGHPESPRLDCMYISAGCLDRVDRSPARHVSFEEHSDLIDGFSEIPRYRAKTDEEIE
jgi:hypothetical protein